MTAIAGAVGKVTGRGTAAGRASCTRPQQLSDVAWFMQPRTLAALQLPLYSCKHNVGSTRMVLKRNSSRTQLQLHWTWRMPPGLQGWLCTHKVSSRQAATGKAQKLGSMRKTHPVTTLQQEPSRGDLQAGCGCLGEGPQCELAVVGRQWGSQPDAGPALQSRLCLPHIHCYQALHIKGATIVSFQAPGQGHEPYNAALHTTAWLKHGTRIGMHSCAAEPGCADEALMTGALLHCRQECLSI